VGDAEILTEIRVPIRPGCGSAYEKVERRVGDWAVGAVGACLCLDDDGTTVVDAGIGLAAVGADHFRSVEAEDLLRGEPVDDDRFAAAAAAAAESCNPSADQRGPVDYKRHLAQVLTLRALRRAAARAQGREA
jgi:carbon-monoxide dehydrogenase medium subunit